MNDTQSPPPIASILIGSVFVVSILLIIVLLPLSRRSTLSNDSPVPVTVVPTASLPTPQPVTPLPTPTHFGDGAAAVHPPTATPFVLSATPDSGYRPLPTLPPDQRTLIFNGPRTEPLVALTFDVGETADNPASFDRDIIQVLNETQTPATFFLGGLWMVHNEAATRELAANHLFELGNHAWSHLDFSAINAEQMHEEVVLTQQVMWDILGWQTELFRLPYGTYNAESLEVIGEAGLLTIQWDVVSGDPDPDILAGPMADWVIQQVQPGSIIIMHANGRGWHTAEALPKIISTLEAQGYTFVTLSELLQLENRQSPLFSD